MDLDAKASFLTNIGHELRTPLTTILGFGNLIQSDLSETELEDPKENIEMVLKSGEYLLKLINNILDISKVEEGMVNFHFEEINFLTLLVLL